MSISEEVRNRTYFDTEERRLKMKSIVLEKVTEMGTATQRDVADSLGVKVHTISGRFTNLCSDYLLRQVGERGNGKETVYAPIKCAHERRDLINTDIQDTNHLIDAIESDRDKIATLELSQVFKHIINKEHKKATKRLKELKEMVL